MGLRTLVLRQSADSVSPINFYARSLLLYREGDVSALEAWLAGHARIGSDSQAIADGWKMVLSLSGIRIQIRKRSLQMDALAKLEADAQTGFHGAWRGELLFVLGMANDVIGNQPASKRCYEAAYAILEQHHCPKKALKCLLNAVAAESRIYPEKRLLNDYHYVYRMARQASEASIAGIALLNMSREYQKLGARSAALKYVNRALAVLKPTEFGSQQYELCIAHRCHLLIELGRTYEADVNLDCIRSSPFLEVQASVVILIALRSSVRAKAPEKGLLPTWAERVNEKCGKSLSQLEQDLLNSISEEPRTKFDLIRILYGNHLKFETAENRFNNLLNRLRKKLPGLVMLKDGAYSIVDEIYLDKRERLGA